MSESATTIDEEVIVRPKAKSKHREKEKDRSRPKTQPPYAVIVENDDFHTFNYVIEVLQKRSLATTCKRPFC